MALHSRVSARRVRRSVVAVGLSLLATSTSASAADRYWVGTDSNWDNPLNWSDAPAGPGGAGVPSGGDVYLLQPSAPAVIPLPARSIFVNNLNVGGSATDPVTVFQADQWFRASSILLGWLGHAMYHQTGGENDADHLYLGGNNAERSAGTYLLDAGDLVSQTQTVGDLLTSAPGLFRQSGGANATAILEIDPTGRYELTAGQLSSREVLLSGGFYQTGGDNAPGYLSIHDTGQYHWSGGTLRITRGLSVYGAFEFPATAAAPVTLYADGLVTLANPAALTNTHNVELVLGPNSLLSHPAGFDPAAAFGSYTNAGLDHVLGTPLVIPAGTSIVSGGAIDDPLDLAGSLVGLDDFSDDLVLYNHFTLRPGGVLGERRGLNFTIRPGAGTSRVLGGTLNAGGIYTGFPLSNVTATATFQQSAGSVTLDALSFDAASFYDLSGGTLTVLDGASLAGTYAAEPRAEFHQTGGSFTARSLFIAGGRQRGALFTIAAGSLTVQAATVGDHYNGNTANYPHTVQFDIAGSNADIRIGALTFQPDSEFTAVPGSTIHLASLSIASTDPDSFPGLAHLRLLFDTGPTQPGQLEVAGADLSPTLAGLVGNFALDTLEVGPADGAGGWLTLIDSVDNQPTFLAHDALYVRELVLNSDATLDLSGLHLYYDHLTNNGGTVLLHGGLLLQLPEPTSLAGLFPCVAALAHRRRRRTFRPASRGFTRRGSGCWSDKCGRINGKGLLHLRGGRV